MATHDIPKIVMTCYGHDEYDACSRARFILPDIGRGMTQVGTKDPADGSCFYRLELAPDTIVPFHRYPLNRTLFLAYGEVTAWLCRNGILKKLVLSVPMTALAVPVGTDVAFVTTRWPAALTINAAGELNGNVRWEEPALRLAQNSHLDPKNKLPV